MKNFAVKNYKEYFLNRPELTVVIVGAVMLLPWLGLILFNTKGEPREAIVAFSMLENGDWILPRSLGTDIPYKPPFLAWLIAAVSWLAGGEVTEYTARFPSAVAAIVMAAGTAQFVKRQGGNGGSALTAALILLTMSEVWRAAWACRVDMVFSTCVVMACYSLFGSKRLWSWGALFWIWGAVLTKGPAGMILPCLIAWVYGLARGLGFWHVTWRLALLGICGLTLPAIWYVAAAISGGPEFVDLMLEENIGRATGQMSYDSHNKPLWYNFVTLAAGALPYTLLGVAALTVRSMWRRGRPNGGFKRWCSRMRRNPGPLFALTAAIVVFIFFSIPESKRSVYLLPMYPFVGFGVMRLWDWLNTRGKTQARAFAGIIIWLVTISAGLIFTGCIIHCIGPELIVRLTSSAAGVRELFGSWWAMFCAALLLAHGIVVLRKLHTNSCSAMERSTLMTLCLGYTFALAAFLPPILNAKSDKQMAREISMMLSDGRPLYQYLDDPRMRFYTINFYIGDRVRPLESADTLRPGDLVIYSSASWQMWKDEGNDTTTLRSIEADWLRKSCDTRRTTLLMRKIAGPSVRK